MQRISQISAIVLSGTCMLQGHQNFFCILLVLVMCFIYFMLFIGFKPLHRSLMGSRLTVVSREAKKEQSESPKTKHTTNYCVISERFHIMMS